MMPSPAETLTFFVKKIDEEWHRPDKDAFALAALCSDGRSAVALHDRVKLLQRARIHKSTFSKLVKIHRDPRLHVNWVRARLPNNYRALDEVRKLTDYQLLSALADCAIGPDLRWRDLGRWLACEPVLKSDILNQLEVTPKASEMEVLLLGFIQVCASMPERPALPGLTNRHLRFPAHRYDLKTPPRLRAT